MSVCIQQSFKMNVDGGFNSLHGGFINNHCR